MRARLDGRSWRVGLMRKLVHHNRSLASSLVFGAPLAIATTNLLTFGAWSAQYVSTEEFNCSALELDLCLRFEQALTHIDIDIDRETQTRNHVWHISNEPSALVGDFEFI